MKRNGFVILVLFCFVLLSLSCVRPGTDHYAGLKMAISDEAISFFKSGKTLARSGDYVNAIQEFKKAIALDNNFSEAYLETSRCYYALGDYDTAMYYNIRFNELSAENAHFKSFVNFYENVWM